jgi:hypothetical protein
LFARGIAQTDFGSMHEQELFAPQVNRALQLQPGLPPISRTLCLAHIAPFECDRTDLADC